MAVGGLKSTASSTRSIRVQIDVEVSKSNPIDNIPKMFGSLMNNIYREVAIPLAATMEWEAKQSAPWNDQERPLKGYPNENARKAITGSATLIEGSGIIVMALAHAQSTYQERSGKRGGFAGRLFYGNILETGSPDGEGPGGEYAVLRPVMRNNYEVFQSMIAARAAKGITYRGADRPATRPTKSRR